MRRAFLRFISFLFLFPFSSYFFFPFFFFLFVFFFFFFFCFFFFSFFFSVLFSVSFLFFVFFVLLFSHCQSVLEREDIKKQNVGVQPQRRKLGHDYDNLCLSVTSRLEVSLILAAIR